MGTGKLLVYKSNLTKMLRVSYNGPGEYEYSKLLYATKTGITGKRRPGKPPKPEQAFSQKDIRVSCGRPILGENYEKCNKAFKNLLGDMPPGRPLFNFWLKA